MTKQTKNLALDLMKKIDLLNKNIDWKNISKKDRKKISKQFENISKLFDQGFKNETCN